MELKAENIILDPYLTGCLIGDGGLVGNLTFSNMDEDVLQEVDKALGLYGYYLVKRSADPKRASEYTIKPIHKNSQKYIFYYLGSKYNCLADLYRDLQRDGYNITNHDTLLSVVGLSTKSKRSYLNKYFPELTQKLTYEVAKTDQHSLFIDLLNKYNLRCRFDNKRIPEEYFTLSFEDRLSLLQGLLDTGGNISQLNGRIEFCVSNKQLAYDVKRLVESLCNVNVCFYTKQAKYFNKKYNEIRYGKIAYRVIFRAPAEIQCFRCKRKLEIYQQSLLIKRRK